MPSYSTIVLALSAAAAAAPLAARSNVCGVEPSASVSSSKAPLQTYTNANTAEECYAKCGANSSCKSFIFGLVDSAIKCELFDCIASQIPEQDSANFVAFDKGCPSIPNVKPTTSNPQGLATSDSKTSGQANNSKTSSKSNTSDNSKSEQKTESASTTDKSATKVNQKQAAAAKVSQAAAAKASQKSDQNTESGTNKIQQSESKKTTTTTSTTTESKKCAAAPIGSSTDVKPFNIPSNIASLDACVAACKKNTSCKSCEFGKLATNSANVCRFFSVSASQIPKATTGQSFQVSDITC